MMAVTGGRAVSNSGKAGEIQSARRGSKRLTIHRDWSRASLRGVLVGPLYICGDIGMSKIVQIILTSVVLSIVFPVGAQALSITYTGTVESATGIFSALTPPGSPVGGPIVYDDAAVGSGLVGPADILGIDVNVGGFCFSTGPDGSGCPLQPNAWTPIISIDAAAVTFAGTTPTGGFIDVTAMSGNFFLINFDLTAGTFLIWGGGTASGTFAPVPIPAALWLMIGGLGALMGFRRL